MIRFILTNEIYEMMTKSYHNSKDVTETPKYVTEYDNCTVIKIPDTLEEKN